MDDEVDPDKVYESLSLKYASQLDKYYSNHHEHRAVADAAAEVAFEQLDRNHDGVIDREEFSAGFEHTPREMDMFEGVFEHDSEEELKHKLLAGVFEPGVSYLEAETSEFEHNEFRQKVFSTLRSYGLLGLRLNRCCDAITSLAVSEIQNFTQTLHEQLSVPMGSTSPRHDPRSAMFDQEVSGMHGDDLSENHIHLLQMEMEHANKQAKSQSALKALADQELCQMHLALGSAGETIQTLTEQVECLTQQLEAGNHGDTAKDLGSKSIQHQVDTGSGALNGKFEQLLAQLKQERLTSASLREENEILQRKKAVMQSKLHACKQHVIRLSQQRQSRGNVQNEHN